MKKKNTSFSFVALFGAYAVFAGASAFAQGASHAGNGGDVVACFGHEVTVRALVKTIFANRTAPYPRDPLTKSVLADLQSVEQLDLYEARRAKLPLISTQSSFTSIYQERMSLLSKIHYPLWQAITAAQKLTPYEAWVDASVLEVPDSNETFNYPVNCARLQIARQDVIGRDYLQITYDLRLFSRLKTRIDQAALLLHEWLYRPTIRDRGHQTSNSVRVFVGRVFSQMFRVDNAAELIDLSQSLDLANIAAQPEAGVFTIGNENILVNETGQGFRARISGNTYPGVNQYSFGNSGGIAISGLRAKTLIFANVTDPYPTRVELYDHTGVPMPEGFTSTDFFVDLDPLTGRILKSSFKVAEQKGFQVDGIFFSPQVMIQIQTDANFKWLSAEGSWMDMISTEAPHRQCSRVKFWPDTQALVLKTCRVDPSTDKQSNFMGVKGLSGTFHFSRDGVLDTDAILSATDTRLNWISIKVLDASLSADNKTLWIKKVGPYTLYSERFHDSLVSSYVLCENSLTLNEDGSPAICESVKAESTNYIDSRGHAIPEFLKPSGYPYPIVPVNGTELRLYPSGKLKSAYSRDKLILGGYKIRAGSRVEFDEQGNVTAVYK